MFRYDNGDGTNALLDPTSPEFRRMKNSIEGMVIPISFLFFLDHGNPFSFFEIMVYPFLLQNSSRYQPSLSPVWRCILEHLDSCREGIRS